MRIWQKNACGFENADLADLTLTDLADSKSWAKCARRSSNNRAIRPCGFVSQNADLRSADLDEEKCGFELGVRIWKLPAHCHFVQNPSMRIWKTELEKKSSREMRIWKTELRNKSNREMRICMKTETKLTDDNPDGTASEGWASERKWWHRKPNELPSSVRRTTYHQRRSGLRRYFWNSIILTLCVSLKTRLRQIRTVE